MKKIILKYGGMLAALAAFVNKKLSHLANKKVSQL